MKRIEDIADGGGDPTEVPDNVGGTYSFPGGAVGIGENNINDIAPRLEKGGYITSIDEGLMVKYYCYLDPNEKAGAYWWNMGIELYDLRTGTLLERDSMSIPEAWGYTPVINDIWSDRDDRRTYFRISFGWAVNGAVKTVFIDKIPDTNTTWYISGSAPVYIQN